MAASRSPRPTLAQSLAVFLPGVAIVALSVMRASAGFDSVDPNPSLLPIFSLFAGGVLFSIGGVMLLVAVVRPLFGVRPADTLADQIKDDNPKR